MQKFSSRFAQWEFFFLNLPNKTCRAHHCAPKKSFFYSFTSLFNTTQKKIIWIFSKPYINVLKRRRRREKMEKWLTCCHNSYDEHHSSSLWCCLGQTKWSGLRFYRNITKIFTCMCMRTLKLGLMMRLTAANCKHTKFMKKTQKSLFFLIFPTLLLLFIFTVAQSQNKVSHIWVDAEGRKKNALCWIFGGFIESRRSLINIYSHLLDWTVFFPGNLLSIQPKPTFDYNLDSSQWKFWISIRKIKFLMVIKKIN